MEMDFKKVKFNALVLRTEDYARAAAPEYRAEQI